MRQGRGTGGEERLNMAATEEVASDSNWHVPVWTAVGEIWLQGEIRVYIVQEGI